MRNTLTTINRQLAQILRILRYRHLFLVCVLVFLITFKAFWSPDILFLVFLSVFTVYGQGKEYIRKFAPFVLLLVSYDALRGFVPFISTKVHFSEMINIDKWLGHGQIPTIILQNAWYHGTLQWYDYYFYFAYMLHFLAPFLLAMVLWKYRPGKYWQYAISLLALSYAGFITYMLFPAAPPWLAAEMHLTDPIAKLSTIIWWGWGLHTVPNIYAHLNPNPVAAVPSLHAAYPMLDLLFVYKFFGRKAAIPFLIYPISVWLGIVYLGEHYVIDVILGILYATGIYLANEYILRMGHHKVVIARFQALRARLTRRRSSSVEA